MLPPASGAGIWSGQGPSDPAVSHATASKFVITGASTLTSGLTNALTISAKDAYGNTATAYTGDKSLTFSGANANATPVLQPSVTDKTGAAVDFGTATTITFTNGVSSAGGSMVLYKAETANIVATQGGSTQLDEFFGVERGERAHPGGGDKGGRLDEAMARLQQMTALTPDPLGHCHPGPLRALDLAGH